MPDFFQINLCTIVSVSFCAQLCLCTIVRIIGSAPKMKTSRAGSDLPNECSNDTHGVVTFFFSRRLFIVRWTWDSEQTTNKSVLP